jgi:hypothetical protein
MHSHWTITLKEASLKHYPHAYIFVTKPIKW